MLLLIYHYILLALWGIGIVNGIQNLVIARVYVLIASIDFRQFRSCQDAFSDLQARFRWEYFSCFAIAFGRILQRLDANGHIVRLLLLIIHDIIQVQVTWMAVILR